MSFRMGGYLFVYVFVSIVMFVYLAWRLPRPKAYWVLGAALALDGHGRDDSVIS